MHWFFYWSVFAFLYDFNFYIIHNGWIVNKINCTSFYRDKLLYKYILIILFLDCLSGMFDESLSFTELVQLTDEKRLQFSGEFFRIVRFFRFFLTVAERSERVLRRAGCRSPGSGRDFFSRVKSDGWCKPVAINYKTVQPIW